MHDTEYQREKDNMIAMSSIKIRKLMCLQIFVAVMILPSFFRNKVKLFEREHASPSAVQ